MFDIILQSDAEQFLNIFKEVNQKSPAKVEEVNEELVLEFAEQARGDICAIQAVIGGISAQEVMKVRSGEC